MVDKGFLNEACKSMLLVHDDIDTLLDQMSNYKVPAMAKWPKHEA